ncbi:hypothetical protein ACFL3G_06665 [Planctomycetota bacterium]
MKRLIISILILSVLPLSSVVALADTEIKKSQHRTDKQEVVQVKDKGHKQTTDANNTIDPNKTQIDEEDEMEKALLHIDQESKKEVREWLNRKVENRIALAKAVQKQVDAELKFLREIAVGEGSEKTVQAVDQLLAARNKRFEKIIKKLQVERKSDRMKTREERKDRRQGKGSRRSHKQTQSR